MRVYTVTTKPTLYFYAQYDGREKKWKVVARCEERITDYMWALTGQAQARQASHHLSSVFLAKGWEWFEDDVILRKIKSNGGSSV